MTGTPLSRGQGAPAAVIELAAVSVSYASPGSHERLTVLDRVSLVVNVGDCVVVAGRS